MTNMACKVGVKTCEKLLNMCGTVSYAGKMSPLVKVLPG